MLEAFTGIVKELNTENNKRSLDFSRNLAQKG